MSQRFARTKAGHGRATGWPARRAMVATLAVVAAVGSRGCATSGSDPGPSPSGQPCGDGICSPFETITSCPQDCAPGGRCGDGVCAGNETCASCPADCEEACGAACQAVDLHALVPAVIRDSTASDPSSTNQAMCGDGATGPLRRYRLTSLPAGRYRVSATGSFDVVVDARSGICGGHELGCQVAYPGNVATFVLTAASAQTIVVTVAGLGGGAGDFTLDITPEPVCGDSICQDETCSSCPSDCGVCPAPLVCGDGVCDEGRESCASCSADCGVCPAPPVCGDRVCDGGRESCASCSADCGVCPAPSVCGDGTCDAGETCGSCAADCGPCGPSCGNGWCDFGEDCGSCPFDCGTCASACGDGWCDLGEDCSTCSFDCGACPAVDPTSPTSDPDPWPPTDPGAAPSGLRSAGQGSNAGSPPPTTTPRR